MNLYRKAEENFPHMTLSLASLLSHMHYKVDKEILFYSNMIIKIAYIQFQKIQNFPLMMELK